MRNVDNNYRRSPNPAEVPVAGKWEILAVEVGLVASFIVFLFVCLFLILRAMRIDYI